MTRSIYKSQVASTRAVCIGGGTGMPASIKALMQLDITPNAIVSVADDGGSSGLLRAHTGQVPPGDLRKCLVALASNPQSPWVKAFQERFEYANDHTLGNLMLTALQETTGSLEQSIQLCEDLLATQGHVLPASFESVLLMGVTQDGQKIVGQSVMSKAETALARVSMSPANAQANPAAVAALKEAELIILGPGSLFTSVIPNLLIKEILDAIKQSSAPTVFVCSLSDVQGETWGLNALELVEALEAHGLKGRLNYMVANSTQDTSHKGNITGYFSALDVKTAVTQDDATQKKPTMRNVVLSQNMIDAIRKRGVKVLTRNLSDAQRPSWHSIDELAKAFASIIADSKGL